MYFVDIHNEEPVQGKMYLKKFYPFFDTLNIIFQKYETPSNNF